ncbi:hypothetical protein M3Y99_01636800 [Aphelenchoides fujianensis]|nr:hypothetical protein M3Y99_01636800 [Aphelenchoides fujianensis]
MPSESTLTRSGPIEHLELTSLDKNEHAEAGAVGNLHDPDDRYFDSRDYRLCFNVVHAKIGAFIFCTAIVHQVIIAALYVLLTEEFKEGNSSLYILLVCRIFQIPTIALFYIALWQYRKRYLIPFAIVQFSIGIFADISTLLLFIRELEHEGGLLPFGENLKWLNILLPLALYFALVALLLHVLYRVYNYLGARAAHDERRRLTKEQAQMKEAINGSNHEAVAFLNTANARSSPPPTQRTQNLIAMSSVRRAPSSQSRASKFSAEQLKNRQLFLRQQSARNPTGSLQQLPSSFTSRQSVASVATNPVAARRLMSLSNSPYQRPAYDQSEPTIPSMFVNTKGSRPF